MNALFAATSTPAAWHADPLRRMRVYMRALTVGQAKIFYRQGVVIIRYEDMSYGVVRNGYAVLFGRTKNCKSLDGIIERAAKFAVGLQTDDIGIAETVDEFDA